MPDEKPSWCTSTLSQAFIGSLGFYCFTLFLVTVGLIGFKLNVDHAKLIIGWASALQASITAAYLTARRTSGEKKANNEHEAPPASPG